MFIGSSTTTWQPHTLDLVATLVLPHVLREA